VDDLRDLEWQLLELLGGAVPAGIEAPPERAILVARDLLPSQLLALEAGRLGGICTVSPAATSHVAILAQSMGLPMLAGVDAGLLDIAGGTPLLLDADAGIVTPAPGAHAAAEAEARMAARHERRTRLREAAREPGRTADGTRIEVYANVASPAEAAAAVESGAEGCGLLRTEFLFLDRADAPGREEQAGRYQAIVDAFGGRPVVIRTLDAGGDKAMPFLPMPPEENPALGLRGIRAGLWRPEILRTQLAAILAVQPPGRCRILLPMVNEPGEIAAVRRLLVELPGGAQATLGVMIETPAAAVDAARLARDADFLSIGTNDLSQYVLATDRTHPLLAAKLDALHPAVLRLVGRVCEAAQAAGRPVSMCGGLASEPAAAPLLAGLGAGALSATPAAVPAVKDALRRVTLAQCRALAARALLLESAAAVREALES
jgi:phosphocarrier protein FPr/phosphocarrier protein